MKHFHLIVRGYRDINVATRGADKESLWYCVYTHLKAILQTRAVKNNDIELYKFLDTEFNSCISKIYSQNS